MFDPYHIFKRRVHSSHTGQVIRKKNLGDEMKQAYTQDDVRQAIVSLQAMGYKIYPPFTPSFDSFVLDRSYHFELELGPLLTNGSTPEFIHFSDIWGQVSRSYSEIFQYAPSQIKQFQLSIAVNSFLLYGNLTQNPQNNSTRLRFLVPKPGSTDRQIINSWNIGSIIPAASTTEGLYMINQYSQTQYLTYACFDRSDARTARDLNYVDKDAGYTYTDTLFATAYNDIALYESLSHNVLPEAYNPALIGFAIISTYDPSFTATNSMLSFTLQLGIKL